MELKCKKCGGPRKKGVRKCNKCLALDSRVPRTPPEIISGEIWKPVVGNDRYAVSNLGRVMSLFTTNSSTYNPALLNPASTPLGYRFCTISPKKSSSVHRLVAMAFIPNPENKPEVNHKDFNPSNNNVDNLEWVTHAENLQYSAALGRFKHSEKQKSNFLKLQERRRRPVNQLALTGEFMKRFETTKEALMSTKPNSSNGKASNITLACRNPKRTAYGFRWEFAEKSNTVNYIGI